MRHLIAVGCSREQGASQTVAKELYRSERFRVARRIAERHSSDDKDTDWIILSGKHGLLDPDTAIEPYDYDLETASETDQRNWADNVARRIGSRVLSNDQVTILAVGVYAELLLTKLRPKYFVCAPLLRHESHADRMAYLQCVEDEQKDLFFLRRILSRYTRPLIHMHHATSENALGLVLGAGASMDLGFPSWDELVDRIANHKDVNNPTLLGKAPDASSRAQLLYHAFRANRLANPGTTPTAKQSRQIDADWYKIIHECLYEKAAHPTEFVTKDSYLWAFLPAIERNPLTINYNFDDSIELMLDSYADSRRKASEGMRYRTAWTPNALARSRQSLIFHPNGYLPRSLKQRPGGLTFSEAGYADQLIESMGVKYASFLHNLAHTTYLFLGVSLQDGTLRNLLRQSANQFPGHYHYHIHFIGDKSHVPPEQQATIRSSRFDVLNVVTLFLCREEIAALGFVLSWDSTELDRQLRNMGLESRLRVFLSGVRAVGKTTTVSNFHSIGVFEEWPARRPDLMEKDPETLTQEEREEIDRWVDLQIAAKNELVHNAPIGLHIIDRAPLDAFAFIPESERQDRAIRIRDLINSESGGKGLCDGHVFLLTGDEEVLSIRCVSRHVEINEDRLKKEQDLHAAIYSLEDTPSVTVINTKDKSIATVVKEVGRSIFLDDELPPFSFDTRLDEIVRSAVNV